MSATTENATAHRNTRGKGESEHKANGAAPETSAPAVSAPADLGTVTIELAGVNVQLPVKFGPGHVLTDAQAKVLDAAYQRQFTNNQNAMGKARAENFAKATTDAERLKYAPLSATALAALYTDYEPSVGGTRTSSIEKMRLEAAWRVWVEMVEAHNASVKDGTPPVFAKRAGRNVPLPSTAILVTDETGKPIMGTDGKQQKVTLQEQRDNLANGLLARPEFADRIQAMLDKVQAEKGKSKDKADATESVASVDDLF